MLKDIRRSRVIGHADQGITNQRGLVVVHGLRVVHHWVAWGLTKRRESDVLVAIQAPGFVLGRIGVGAVAVNRAVLGKRNIAEALRQALDGPGITVVWRSRIGN